MSVPADDPLAPLARPNLAAIVRLNPDAAPDAADPRMLDIVAGLGALPRRDAAPVNWAGARQWQVLTRDGLRLTMQAVPAAGGALLRLTADPQPGASPEAGSAAARLRAVRNRAYVLGPAATTVLFGPSAAPMADATR